MTKVRSASLVAVLVGLAALVLALVLGGTLTVLGLIVGTVLVGVGVWNLSHGLRRRMRRLPLARQWEWDLFEAEFRAYVDRSARRRPQRP